MNIEKLSDRELINLCKEYGAKALSWRRRFIALLPEVAVQNIKSQQQAATPGCKMSFEVDEETELELRKFKQKLEKQRKEPVSFNETLKELLKQVREEPGTPRPNTKTNGKCSRCKQPASQFHHPDRQSLKPGHENVIPLCKICHQLAHSGRVINENNHPSTWRVQAKILESPKVRIDRKVQRHWRAA